MKKYKIKKTKKLIKQLSKYWKSMKGAENFYNMMVSDIEKRMEKETGIKGIEFFYSDGYVGIGNIDRTMPLIHDKELESV